MCGQGTGTRKNVVLSGDVFFKSNGYLVNYNTGRNGEFNPNLDMIRYFRVDPSEWSLAILSQTSITTAQE